VPFTARRDGRALDVAVRAFDVRAGGAVLVDDVRVSRVPAPQTSDRSLAGVRYGTSVEAEPLDWHRQLKKSDNRFSKLEIVRVFEPDLRNSWQGRLRDVRRPVAVSFVAQPQRVIDGDFNDEIRAWFRDAPRDHPVWWTYFHEPENDVMGGDFTPRQYRKAWRHVADIAARAGSSNLKATLILMAWTAQPSSGRSVRDYYPGGFIDVVGWDGYNPPSSTSSYVRPRRLYGLPARWSNRLDARFAIAEFGAKLLPGDDGSRRASWMVDIASYAAKRDAVFVSYWDAKSTYGDFRLHDLPSIRAWRGVVKG
jgi:beta-mannanase